jgi:hypothetical protein
MESLKLTRGCFFLENQNIENLIDEKINKLIILSCLSVIDKSI